MRRPLGALAVLAVLAAAVALGCGGDGDDALPTEPPATASPGASATATATASPSPMPAPTATPSPTPSASPAPTPSSTPSASPAPTPSSTPSASPTPTPSPTPPASPSPTQTATPAPTPSATPNANAGLLALVETLRGRAQAPRRYERADFPERLDLDDDCIDTRHEVLIEEAVGPVELGDDGCYVTQGEWHDPFTDQTFTNPRDLQVDHVVALADAWYAGAWAWSAERRAAFANDPANLNAIDGEENQRKSAWGPADYAPANAAHRCAYLEQYARVKVEWGLAVTERDFAALEEGLTACAGEG